MRELGFDAMRYSLTGIGWDGAGDVDRDGGEGEKSECECRGGKCQVRSTRRDCFMIRTDGDCRLPTGERRWGVLQRGGGNAVMKGGAGDAGFLTMPRGSSRAMASRDAACSATSAQRFLDERRRRGGGHC